MSKAFKYLLLLGLLLLPILATHAQETAAFPPGNTTILFPGTQFFAVLIGGILMAIGFQFILSFLSLALGLDMLSPLTAPKRERRRRQMEAKPGEAESVHETVRGVSNAFGIWTLVTATLSLFFAAWLGVKLSPTTSTLIGMVLGLAIWALFTIIMVALEATAFSSLVGSLFRVAGYGLRTAYNTVTSVFGKSEASKAADVAEKVTERVRDELFGGADLEDLKDVLEDYVDKLKPQKFDASDIRRELAKLLNETDIQAVVTHEGPFFDRDQVIASLQTESGMREEEARSAVDTVNEALQAIREERLSGKGRAEKVVDTALRMTGLSREEAQSYRQKVEDYLRRTGKEELNPEGIKHDLEQLFTEPKAGAEALRSRLSQMDKDTVAALLEQRQDMTEDEAHRIADQIDSAVHQLMEGATGVRESFVDKIRSYLNNLGRPELRYEGIVRDMKRLFTEPKVGAEAMLNRLKAIDRDTLVAILASRSDISHEDAERIIGRIEEARDSVIEKAQEMKEEVALRLDEAKEEAIRQADETRKTAAVAAWWAFATIIVSGIGAAIGGIIAASTGL